MKYLNFDIWYIIFEYLERKDIYNLTLVSKQFCEAASIKILNSIYLDDHNYFLDNDECLDCFSKNSYRWKNYVR